MERKYMVVRFGVNKETGEPYSRASRLKEAKDGTSWGYLDEKDPYYLDEIRPLGTVVAVELTEV